MPPGKFKQYDGEYRVFICYHVRRFVGEMTSQRQLNYTRVL